MPRVVVLHGEFEVDHIVCPITSTLEAAIPKLAATVQQWADADVYLEDKELDAFESEQAWRFDTATEGLEAAEEWVNATNPQAP